MQNLNSLIEKAGQNTTTEKQESISRHSPDMMMKIWRGLLAFRLVHEPIGSTDFKYWDRSLAEFSDDDLVAGLKLTADHKGFLTIGNFREYCKPQNAKAAHKLFLPKLSVKASKETKAKYMAQLRAML